jgi:hypothetical protein
MSPFRLIHVCSEALRRRLHAKGAPGYVVDTGQGGVSLAELLTAKSWASPGVVDCRFLL